MVQNTHSDIVNELGIDALANATGLPPIAIKRWQQRNRIPADWWCRVVELGKNKRVRGLTCEHLAKIIAK